MCEILSPKFDVWTDIDQPEILLAPNVSQLSFQNWFFTTSQERTEIFQPHFAGTYRNVENDFAKKFKTAHVPACVAQTDGQTGGFTI